MVRTNYNKQWKKTRRRKEIRKDRKITLHLTTIEFESYNVMSLTTIVSEFHYKNHEVGGVKSVEKGREG